MIFTRVQTIDDYRVRINSKTRSLLGLINESSLQGCLTESIDPVKKIPGIIVTSYDFSNWQSIWTLTCKFNDRKGLLFELIELLQEHDIDILDAKAFVSDQGNHLQVRIDFDAQNYTSTYDFDSNTRLHQGIMVLEELEASILAKFIDEMVFVQGLDSFPDLVIKRNTVLMDSKKSSLHKGKVSLDNNYLNLNNRYFSKIWAAYLEKYPNINHLGEEDRKPQCCVLSELESSLIRIFVFYKNTGHLHFRVKFKDETGAISSITNLISERFLNILQLNTRRVDNSTLISDMLVHFDYAKDKFRSDEKLIEYVSAIFESKELKKDFKCEFIIPKRDGE